MNPSSVLGLRWCRSYNSPDKSCTTTRGAQHPTRGRKIGSRNALAKPANYYESNCNKSDWGNTDKDPAINTSPKNRIDRIEVHCTFHWYCSPQPLVRCLHQALRFSTLHLKCSQEGCIFGTCEIRLFICSHTAKCQ